MSILGTSSLTTMVARQNTTVDIEAANTASAASYQITVALRPARLTHEQKRAIASVMRKHARELQLVMGLLVPGTSTHLSYTSSGMGGAICDINDLTGFEDE